MLKVMRRRLYRHRVLWCIWAVVVAAHATVVASNRVGRRNNED